MPRLPRAATAITAWSLIAACGAPQVIYENDALGAGRGSDRNYSSGFRMVYALPREEAPAWAVGLADAVFSASGGPAEALVLSAGHHIYTPDDLESEEPILDDRPYAAWVYGGVAAYDAIWDDDPAAHDRQKVVELVIGLVGPNAFGEAVQKELHEISGATEPKGWEHQLDDELTAMLSIEAQRRLWRREGERYGVDAISHFGGSLGTPYTMVGSGVDLRFGYRLPRDFGISTSEPVLVATSAVKNGLRPSSIYGFVGLRGRLVAWNTFLDGNAFTESQSVEREPIVGDLLAGLAWQHRSLRVHFTFVYRTQEFETVEDEGHVFGSIGVTWDAP